MALHISFCGIYFYKGTHPIKDYIFKQLEKYVSKKNNIKSDEKDKNKIKKKKDQKKIKNESGPPKKKDTKLKMSRTTKSIKKNINNSSLNKMKSSYRDIIQETKTKDTLNKKKSIISNIPTQGEAAKKMHSKGEKIINFNLINFNFNNNSKNKNSYSTYNYILNIYSFKEAIKKDLRSVCKIFYIYLLTKQAIFHAFFYNSPLVLFPLRFCLLIFIISSDFALNALFYFDNKISEKYRYTKNIFLFALTKNVTIILLSTFIGFLFLTLFTKLSTSINDIREVFNKEGHLIKKNKNHTIDKKQIKNSIENILKKYKIKIIILIIIQILLLLLFWYYVTVFCHVYSSTQKSWILDSILSMLFRIIIDSLLCLFFAKLYRIAVESNCLWIYKVSLFFYSFC